MMMSTWQVGGQVRSDWTSELCVYWDNVDLGDIFFVVVVAWNPSFVMNARSVIRHLKSI